MNVIITGATGMVGEGVLIECLNHPQVEKILLVGRKLTGYTHSKIKEVVLADFFNVSSVESELAGYDACFFCLGVSSIGMKEEDYRRLTYDLTLNFAKAVLKLNPNITFSYISGAGTSSEEKGQMWAKVKGKTENDLRKMSFKNVYLFRPGFLQPTPGAKNTLKLYNYLGWLVPILKTLMPGRVGSLRELGQAMINTTLKASPSGVLEVKDIQAMAK